MDWPGPTCRPTSAGPVVRLVRTALSLFSTIAFLAATAVFA